MYISSAIIGTLKEPKFRLVPDYMEERQRKKNEEKEAKSTNPPSSRWEEGIKLVLVPPPKGGYPKTVSEPE